MKYKVKTYSDWNWSRYFFSDDGDVSPVRNKETNEYETDSAETVRKIVKDWLDAPDREMTAEDVHREYDYETRVVQDEYVAQIMKYYNGRKAVYEKFCAELDAAEAGSVLRYDLPYELCHFETEQVEDSFNETMNETFFCVSVGA